MFFKVLLRFCGANSGFGVSKFCGFSKFCSTFVDQFEIRFFKGFAPLLRGKFKIRFFKVFRFFKSFTPLLWSEFNWKVFVFWKRNSKVLSEKTSQSMYCPKTFKTSKILFIFIKIYLKNKITHGNQAHGNQLLSCLIEQWCSAVQCS